MELYSRRKFVSVALTGRDELTAKAGLDDGVHEVQVIVVCRATTAEIVSAQAEMIKYPWNLCETAGKAIALIEGIKIGPGIRREVEKKIGQKEGCTHVADLVIEAIRGIIQVRYRLRYWPTTQEERIKMVQEDLKETCFTYSHPELPMEVRGDWSEGSLSEEVREQLKQHLDY